MGCAPWASTVLCVLSRLMIRPSDYVAKATRAPRYQNILFVTNILVNISAMDPAGYVSYRSSSTVISEGVYQFLRGSLFGAIWGAVTPFHTSSSSPSAGKMGMWNQLPTHSLTTHLKRLVQDLFAQLQFSRRFSLFLPMLQFLARSWRCNVCLASLWSSFDEERTSGTKHSGLP